MGAQVNRPCERCNESPTVSRTSRYCATCEKAVKQELKDAGYLTPTPGRSYRPPDARENVRETKHGRDG